MHETPRKTIDYLKSLYFLEPSIKDIYVEGAYDVKVISSWCRDNKERNVVAYDIDAIDIPFEILDKYSLTEGSKQRVIALAHELSDLNSNAYSCLVDKDLDHWLGETPVIPRLFWTDYCSLELYFFDEDELKRMIVDVAQSRIQNWDGFYSSFISVLKKLYSMRLADKEMGLSINWIGFDRCLSVRSNIWFLDVDDYVKRILMANGKMRDRDSYNERINYWFDFLNGDPRDYIRGHDFVELLALSNEKFKGLKPFHDIDAITAVFLYLSKCVDGLLLRLKE
ncbi:DUF4435 domain-containing protein [Pectobacterium parmentieri]|uniref:DUF4435 domain-containing protein n=1 Tax=Pectobacterium parmentieri TaxID=1905730 RepID=UPI0018DF4622|nr:DUF4435 domain-containing protein [Pectobacterium parmentieri]MBI0549489.1 DUF4435 domain-containing protein [Pectobacterium parmentieri]MBI0558429.1 DUF4435 domain-containing protein [Pectobacterium parmentieri]MBI0562482.1 DUF4435 domain-containing protein [Pectobacterium parmentieri]